MLVSPTKMSLVMKSGSFWVSDKMSITVWLAGRLYGIADIYVISALTL